MAEPASASRGVPRVRFAYYRACPPADPSLPWAAAASQRPAALVRPLGRLRSRDRVHGLTRAIRP
ncbi:hypothetical protein DPMN_102437 [Dreissena polymorpha]|uniref:Uncharacterized protein n=1 Tax=Dreissena polymorpha TaxID=45954 RepID=A0A9D4R930_DREPO|nr:hypothetical protein DPMN_102437 [Dreissena polymorpha]